MTIACLDDAEGVVMDARLSKYIREPFAGQVRQIERDYHVQMISRNPYEIRAFEAAVLRNQVVAADLALREMGEARLRQEALVQSCEGIGQGIDRVEERTEELVFGVYLLDQHLTEMASQLVRLQETLEGIAEILRRPYEAKALELRRAGEKWLMQGMRTVGRDREENWKDAMRLLRSAVDNPVGMQDYVAWFQIGWLLWRQQGQIEEAADAFYRAQRLSAPSQDAYHVKSSRHLSHMHYLRNEYEDAYCNLSRAVDVLNHVPKVVRHNFLFDRARYAAKTSREGETIDLLDQCIELYPVTYLKMFAETDLGVVDQGLADFAERRLDAMRAEVEKRVENWRAVREKCQLSAKRAQCTIPPMKECTKEVEDLRQAVEEEGYITLLAVSERIHQATREVLQGAKEIVYRELESRRHQREDIETEIESVEQDKREALSPVESDWAVGCWSFILLVFLGPALLSRFGRYQSLGQRLWGIPVFIPVFFIISVGLNLAYQQLRRIRETQPFKAKIACLQKKRRALVSREREAVRAWRVLKDVEA